MVCGIYEYRVYRAKASEMPEPTDEGVTHIEDRKILIREDLDKARYGEVLQHELRHAWWDASGLGAYFASVTKLSGKKLEEAEEIFIRMDTPAGLSTMKSFGLLRGRYTGT
jgi:hypothetical protein